MSGYLRSYTYLLKGIDIDKPNRVWSTNISMDSKERATDNIAIKGLWRSVKCERIYLQEYQSMKDLKRDFHAYFHFYNYHRFHQTLEYKRPMEVFDKHKYLKTIKRNESMNTIQILQKVA